MACIIFVYIQFLGTEWHGLKLAAREAEKHKLPVCSGIMFVSLQFSFL